MSYYFSKILTGDFDDALKRTTDVLKEQGFGIITEIDVKETFKKKIGVDFRNYRILGACNPKLAYEALQLEDKIGRCFRAMSWCRMFGEGKTEVAAIDPVALMLAVENADLKRAAERVREMMKKVIEKL